MGIKIFIVAKWLIALAFLIFGIFVLIQSQDANFVPRPATVIESKKSYGLTASEDRLPGIQMHFGYRYSFQGKEYLGKRVTHGYLNQGLGVKRFKKGTSLRVFVNPDNPGYAVIKKGVQIAFYLMTFTGIVLLTNLLLEACIVQFDRKKLERPEWLQTAFNATGPMLGISFLATALMLVL